MSDVRVNLFLSLCAVYVPQYLAVDHAGRGAFSGTFSHSDCAFVVVVVVVFILFCLSFACVTFV